MLPSKVIIVDANALCYAAHFGIGGLGTAQGPTGIIYGFFAQLQTICKLQQAAHLVFCWDSHQSHRKRIFKGYKDRAKQKENPALQANYPQFIRLREEILSRLGFVNSFHAIGYEADDLIASICQSPGPKEGQLYIIASGDADLYQLLTDSVVMWKFNKRQIYTEQDFRREHQIHPVEWSMVKALAGCSSDTVPGIQGVGEKTAIKYIKSGCAWNKKIDTMMAKDLIQRNLKLVQLPFKNTPKYKLDWETPPSYAEWLTLCEELEFYSFLRNPKVWENIFSGVAPTTGAEKIIIKPRTK